MEIKPMPEFSRDTKIAIERLRGKTFAKIAEKYRISEAQARNICYRQAVEFSKKENIIATFEARLDTAPGLGPKRIDRIFGEFAKRIKDEMAALPDAVPRNLKKDTPLDSLGFSVRTARALRDMGATTVADAEKITSHQLMEIPNFGKRSLLEFRSVFPEP